MLNLTEHQRFAIENPCLLAIETADRKNWRKVGDCSVVLTVDAGWE